MSERMLIIIVLILSMLVAYFLTLMIMEAL